MTRCLLSFDSIGMENAWDISTGSSSVMVGILDSGIELNNANLANRVDTTLSRSFLTGATNGVPGGLDDACSFSGGHGTAVAGIIGANGTGVIGVNWDVKLVSLQILKYEYNVDECLTNWAHVINAINYATGNNIPILNTSIRNVDVYSPSNHTAFTTAINNYPGLFVAAAGNNGENLDSKPDYPAAYNLPNMITVGALNDNYANPAPAGFSNYSPTKVHLFAPGTSIQLTYGEYGATSYYSAGGTSYAAPFVAGVAALIKAYRNMHTPQIKAIILNNVMPKSSLNGMCATEGILNAHQALTLTQACVSQLDACNATHDPVEYLTMCQNECWEQAPSYCYPPIDYV